MINCNYVIPEQLKEKDLLDFVENQYKSGVFKAQSENYKLMLSIRVLDLYFEEEFDLSDGRLHSICRKFMKDFSYWTLDKSFLFYNNRILQSAMDEKMDELIYNLKEQYLGE